MFGIGVNNFPLLWIILLVLWTLPWKGYALWLAARNGHTIWFIALLIVNTLAILDIIYIFAVGRPAEKRGSSGK
jgi:hypothetical protein